MTVLSERSLPSAASFLKSLMLPIPEELFIYTPSFPPACATAAPIPEVRKIVDARVKDMTVLMARDFFTVCLVILLPPLLKPL